MPYSKHLSRLKELNSQLSKQIPPEVLLTALTEMILDGMAIVNPDGVIISATPTFANTFDYSQSELVGQQVHMLVPEEFRDVHKELVKGYFTDPVALKIPKRVLVGRRKNGDPINIHLGIIPFEDNVVAVIQREW